MDNDLTLQLNTEPDPLDLRELEDRLYEFNAQATGITDGRLLSYFLRDDAGGIVAGLYGWTWGSCLEIRTLWVDKSLRLQGIGAKLLGAAEQEARRCGCTLALVGTHSFQAPEFYKRFGYEVFGAMDEYPAGHKQLYLKKRLTA